MALPDCFHCVHRDLDKSKTCELVSECVANDGKFFEQKPNAKTKADVIRHMSTEQLADFIASFRPDIKEKNANLRTQILGWLKDPAVDDDIKTVWFMR